MESYLRLIAMFFLWCLFGILVGALLFAPFHVAILGGVIGFICAGGYCGLMFHGAEQTILEQYDAELLDIARAPFLYDMLRRVCLRARVEPPVLYVVKLDTANAFIVARAERCAALAVTTGLLRNFSEDELRGVLAILVARITDQNILSPSVGAALASYPIQWIKSEAFLRRFGNRAVAGDSTGLTTPQRVALSVVLPLCTATLRIALDPERIMQADLQAAQWAPAHAIAAALAKIEAGAPTAWWESARYNAATAMLFALPPLLKPELLPEGSPYCVRAQSSFPYVNPSSADRARRLIGNNPLTEFPYVPGSFDYFLGIATPPPIQR